VLLLLEVALGLIASEAWERVKARLASPDPTWADAAARSLEPSLRRALTRAEREAVGRWLKRPDVFAALAASTAETLTQVAERVVNTLEYELGPPSPERKELAAALAAEVVLHVTDLVDPATAATLATHRSIKDDLTDVKLGQVVLLDAIHEVDDQVRGLTDNRELDADALAGFRCQSWPSSSLQRPLAMTRAP